MKTNDFKKMIGNNIFSAVFVKKNGEKRKINCRLGVKKHLKGGTKSYRDEDFNYLCVFDLQKKQYRTINLNTLLEINFNGKKYQVKNTNFRSVIDLLLQQ